MLSPAGAACLGNSECLSGVCFGGICCSAACYTGGAPACQPTQCIPLDGGCDYPTGNCQVSCTETSPDHSSLQYGVCATGDCGEPVMATCAYPTPACDSASASCVACRADGDSCGGSYVCCVADGGCGLDLGTACTTSRDCCSGCCQQPIGSTTSTCVTRGAISFCL